MIGGPWIICTGLENSTIRSKKKDDYEERSQSDMCSLWTTGLWKCRPGENYNLWVVCSKETGTVQSKR
jgi:hypothetical protein